MRTKDDHMKNGQLKPGYNVQFVVNSEFITDAGICADRTDYDTRSPLLDTLEQKHGMKCLKVVTDAGYESLANYRYLKSQGMDAYINVC